MKLKKIDMLYFALPLILWPLVFIVFAKYFIYAMLLATTTLGVFAAVRYRSIIKWRGEHSIAVTVLIGLAAAIVLYAIFFAGNYVSDAVGLKSSVNNVYSTIRTQNAAGEVGLALMLAIIGVFEEFYWRGGLQSYVSKNSAMFASAPWLASTLYYAFVHLSTLNPILVIAAFVVGLTTSIVAYKQGILASAVMHVTWIELVVVIFPVTAIHLVH